MFSVIRGRSLDIEGEKTCREITKVHKAGKCNCKYHVDAQKIREEIVKKKLLINVDNQRISEHVERLYRKSDGEGTNVEEANEDGNILNVPAVDIADGNIGETQTNRRTVDFRSGGIIRSGVMSTGRKKFARRKRERINASNFILTDSGPSKPVDTTILYLNKNG